MAERQIIKADLTWIDGSFRRSAKIAIGDDGMLAAASPNDQATRRLTNRAIIPGMINAHSHAFQRGLRGLGERFPQERGSFWTWREEMYRLVESMDADRMYQLSREAFEEMLAAGVTTVGEFHYLHHDASLDGFALDEVVLRAAKDAGIRIALIQTFYRTGGVDQPLKGGQLRFRTESIEAFLAQLDRLASVVSHGAQSLAVAAHSIRAASIEDISMLHEESIRRAMPFHMHAEEQPKEIEECLQHYGKTPMALINAHLNVNPMFTAVHCTHTAAADMDDYLDRGGNVCINPLTEANLGDGIPNVPGILKRGGRIAIGSDSNARLCWTEEMRWLEYAQRLHSQSRGVIADERGCTAAKLLEVATINGARSLGVKAGRIAPGYAADLVAIDLEAPALRGWTDDTLLDAFVFGTGNEAIAEVCVAGKWVP